MEPGGGAAGGRAFLVPAYPKHTSRPGLLALALALWERGVADTDLHRAWFRLLNAVARGAAAGFCLRGGLSIISALLTLASRRPRRSPLTLREKLRDTLRYTAFLGSFAGVNVGVDEGIAAFVGRER